MVNILLVEDDATTRELVFRSLTLSRTQFSITQAENGREALDILRGDSPTKRVPLPVIVLLDLEMPLMNGFEFLEELRADPKLKSAPVFVLSTSDAIADKDRAFSKAISGYMVKSEMGPGYNKVPTLLERFLDSLN